MILSNMIEIHGPPDVVWRVLTDFANYPTWNRFTPRVACNGVVGAPVTLEARLTDRERYRTVRLTLTEWQPNERICWGSAHWFLRVNRCQSLSALRDGRTRYTNSERFEGILAPLINWTQRNNLMRGYEWVAVGLKRQAEQ